MKHTFKRVACLTLALLMVLALSATAFAAGESGNVYKDDTKTIVSGNNIPLTKSIVMFNKNGSNVYEPNITYTYSVAPVDDAALLGTITDDGDNNVVDGTKVPVTVKVNAGIANGVKFEGTANTIAFSNTNAAVTTEANGVEVQKSTNLTVDISKFEHAGVYRYKITETTNPDDVKAVGIDRGADYSAERYLDVYIANKTDGTGLELSGAVIFKVTAKTGESTPATTAIDTTTEKTTGFEPGKTGSEGADVNYNGDTSSDHYTTYDIEVKKEVSGGMADKTHNFPFYVSLSNTINGAKYTYVDDAGTSTAETISGTGITKGTEGTDSALKLKHGESVKFIGVPSNQTNDLSIMVKEWNDSVDYYSASAKITSGAALDVKMDNNDTATQMAALTGHAELKAAFDVKANDVAAQIITVTNNLAEISPTGITLRVAPYAIMLGFGLALMLFSRKMRKVED